MLPALAIALSLLCAAPDFSRLAEGDIIFQETSGRQSDAIALATKSRYTHVGIVFREKGRWMVLEAVQPVSSIALDRWIARGVKRHYVVKRLAAAPGGIGPDAVQRMKAAAVKYLGRDYDEFFEWSDRRIYCSELVWKLYRETLGVELAPRAKLGDFDLSAPAVRRELRRRYGGSVPVNEPVVPPSALFDSKLLVTVMAAP